VDIREALDLILSTLVVFLAFSISYVFAGDIKMVMAYLLATITAFLFHELAHRGVARSRGVYAVYRAWYPGLLIALIFAIGTRGRFIIVAPGAVEVYMPIYIPTLEASIALAGPLTNIIIAIVCLPLLQLHVPGVSTYIRVVGYVNAFLAFFNLLPIPPLDGFKVLRGSKARWLIAFLLAIVTLLVYIF
jgi:Zn-dependent protease